MALALFASTACRGGLPSIDPEELRETKLVVAAHDHEFDVVASLRVPKGYQLEQTGAMSFDFLRRHRDPLIGVSTAVSFEFKDYEPDTSKFSRCDSSGGDVERVLREEPRADGSVLVCDARLADGRRDSTFVLRDVLWRGHEFQCWVSFPFLYEVDQAYDEAKPTDARVADAIAICDSFTIREMTQTDLEKFYPPVNGSTFYPETK